MMKNTSQHAPFFSRAAIWPRVKSSIVIPVKNEETYILKTLGCFALQVDRSGKPLDPHIFEVLVLANNCTDRSVNYIKDFQHDHPHLHIHLEEVTLGPSEANIGYIRRKLMESAFVRLSQNGGGTILTTDGDTLVAADWIAQTHWEIEHGAEVVGGRILLVDEEFEGLDPCTRLYHLKDEKYNLLIAELEGKIINPAVDPVPRHHQHFNGSFAITSDCYARSGGVPVVEHLEDCAFFEQLQRIDAKIRHSHNVKVHTSARCIGRAEIGLSYQLNAWKNLGDQMEQYFVESCASISYRLQLKKSLLNLWERKYQPELDLYSELKTIFPDVAIDDDGYTSFYDTRYFGAWYEQLIQIKQIQDQQQFPPVPIDTAIEALQIKVQEYADHDFAHTSIL